jgi:hypothetical protein
MSLDGLEPSEAWREQHRAASEALEIVRAQELAALTDERARQIIRWLRPFAPIPPDPLNGMGLARQQAIFHSLKWE